MGKNNPKCPLCLGWMTGANFLFLRLPQQPLKDPYAKFQKKIFSHSQKMVEHTEKETNRQTETDRLI